MKFEFKRVKIPRKNQINQETGLSKIKPKKIKFDLAEEDTKTKRKGKLDLPSPNEWRYQSNGAQTKRTSKTVETHKEELETKTAKNMDLPP